MSLLQETINIQRGLLFYWNCKICQSLGWDKEHGCPGNNKDCPQFVYGKLKEHFEAVARIENAGRRGI